MLHSDSTKFSTYFQGLVFTLLKLANEEERAHLYRAALGSDQEF